MSGVTITLHNSYTVWSVSVVTWLICCILQNTGIWLMTWKIYMLDNKKLFAKKA